MGWISGDCRLPYVLVNADGISPNDPHEGQPDDDVLADKDDKDDE
ncbi:hypothetical protein GCM10009676_16180 [Prauserella halophila]|uniref:Uncharacterized protein n=1 Tax=Prauserella halophila TaxID=185641 RepID=A0ABN1W387_9PSEU|nr:hypothetical protein [Prauserella halophila]MCP2236176.1 hypothetical protein [Prauserella halophila]